ncbi:Coiled-coil protein [Thalictrum thalictroides]|uniref:Coiled-coil protein n=1 Tax=Thalictrum thalictroides TaxID=46969 RepID=A0A7J6V2Z0_THATH|nr:Coiled-coil protein [Thalictrum thalictroides]
MKTDPQNSDYVVEYGASRNYEPWCAKDEEANKEKRKRDSEETGDAIKFLENRTLNSKEEKLEGEAEDEALREANFQGPRAIIIRRIEDVIIGEDEDEELLNHQAKRKVSTDQRNSTDILTQKSILDSS